MIKKLNLLAIVVSVAACISTTLVSSTADADLIYEFTGAIPVGAEDTHSVINPGDTFIGTFIVDDSIMDSETDSSLGTYAASVVSGILIFSTSTGAYVSPLNFAGIDVLVANNFADTSSSSVYDGVAVFDASGGSVAITAITDSLATLSSDSLPAAGTSFSSAPDPLTIDSGVFAYGDALGGVSYDAAVANNVTFSASTIPEPASIAVMGLLGIVGLCWRRR